jgi:tetratricopeptide (TPR) repeat protein
VSTEAYLVHQIAVIHGGRALVHLRRDDLLAMHQEAKTAVALMRQNVQADPRNVAWRDGLMTESNTLAQALLRLGDLPGALAAAQQAQDMAATLAHDEGPQSKWAHASVQALLAGQLGRALQGQGRAAEALPLLEQALQHWRGQAAAPDAQRRAAAFELSCAQARWALGAAPQALAHAHAAVDTLLPLRASPVARDAQLTLAEAHALLMQCEPGKRDHHRAQALAALSAAQASRPLALDHQQLLAVLQA